MAWKRTVILWEGGSRVVATVARAVRASVGRFAVRSVDVERERGRSGLPSGPVSGEGVAGGEEDEELGCDGVWSSSGCLVDLGRCGSSCDSERSSDWRRRGWVPDIAVWECCRYGGGCRGRLEWMDVRGAITGEPDDTC